MSDIETLKDTEFALKSLAMMQGYEDEVFIELPVGAIRSCLELMLSLLEAHEGLDVDGLELFHTHTMYADIPAVLH